MAQIVGAFGVIVVMAVAVRVSTETVPSAAVRWTAPSVLRVPGPPPTLAWPSEGQAAMEVPGVGSFGSVGGDASLPIASMAKMMTAYIVLKDFPIGVGDNGFEYTVTARDVADLQARIALDESTVAVTAGERLSEYQLLQALLIPSGDNIAAILARIDAGTLDAFVAKMNRQARALGMDHTTYTDPSGYLDTTVSTATDQMRLGEAAMQESAFAEIVAQPSVTLPVVGTEDNVDSLAGTAGFVGIKTGSDSQAEGCFTFADVETVAGQRVTIIGAVLDQGQGSPDVVTAALDAAQRLVQSAQPYVTELTLLGAHSHVGTVAGADGQVAPLETAGPLQQLGWGGLLVPLRVSVLVHDPGVRAGQPVARVSTGAGAAADVVATSAVPNPDLWWRLRHVP
jgi:serine-type D-Ala-D-Ala carboxypeptidase (penicillin-binding protein 5/6)